MFRGMPKCRGRAVGPALLCAPMLEEQGAEVKRSCTGGRRGRAGGWALGRSGSGEDIRLFHATLSTCRCCALLHKYLEPSPHAGRLARERVVVCVHARCARCLRQPACTGLNARMPRPAPFSLPPPPPAPAAQVFYWSISIRSINNSRPSKYQATEVGRGGGAAPRGSTASLGWTGGRAASAWPPGVLGAARPCFLPT